MNHQDDEVQMAFPTPSVYDNGIMVECGEVGLSKRELFAALAMMGHAAHHQKKWTISQLIEASVETADALIAALKEKKP